MRKINSIIIQFLKVVEIILAIILMIAIVISTIQTIYHGMDSISTNSFHLEIILEEALTLVVGVEFIKMLVLHTTESVIEVLLYAVARQVIISHDSALENLFGVSAVALIFAIQKFLLPRIKKDTNETELLDD